uniref:Fibrinogen C-terminal domain-containing protein n=1 Tax=Plectus sambesii TaxID=2011161 RepID=A0A914URM5_9BILA
MDCGTENCFICEVYMDDMCTTSLPATNTPSTTLKDCKDWFDQGNRTDGIYPINPDGKGSFNAYCDMTTDGGGWTVFQRRNDDSLSFYDKTWCEYKIGFNNGLENNLWLGNDHIHSLSTKDTNVELRIDLWGDRDPTSPNLVIYLWEKHTNFFIDNEANFYTLHISSAFTGNASTDPSSTMHNSNNLRFSTNDTMNGANPVCFETYNNNGWWISSSIPCSHEALNGKYTPTMWGGSGFCWYTGTYWVNPKQSRMMLRRII